MVTPLTWPRECPMTVDDYVTGAAGANLVNFVRVVNGPQDTWTYTDPAGTSHTVTFAEIPEFQHVEDGFEGTILLVLRT